MSFEDLLKSLQADYLSSLPQKIVIIRAQIVAGDPQELRESFHKLKGTGRTYGLPEVSELAEVVESVCLTTPKNAAVAATQGAVLLEEIHASHSRHAGAFDLQHDSRFQELLKLQAAAAQHE